MAGRGMGSSGGRGGSAGRGGGGRGGPPGGIAEQGRLWLTKGTVTSRGRNANFGWAPRSGSFTRCVAMMTPHVGTKMAKPLCARRFHESLGIWPGSAANRNKRH